MNDSTMDRRGFSNGQGDEGPYRGREPTVRDGPGAGTEPYLGREPTVAGVPDEAGYHGDEVTAPAAAAALYDGSEQTEPLADGGPYRGDEPTCLEEGSFKRPRTIGTRGASTTPSVGFDAEWHLQGRPGPHTGAVWGDYEFGGSLGEGGMGAVYRGVQHSLRRRVAIKVLPPNLADDVRLRERFQLEAGIASRLQSPHIVQVYAIGEEGGHLYYAMEYVDGIDLDHVVRARRAAEEPLATDEVVGYVLQAARGLAEAGRLGIVHRDIKPANMMVTDDGLLKLADFGIVKVLGESNLTVTGQAVGTPAYVSPEQGRGESEVDQRSDIYSLGVAFYELVLRQGNNVMYALNPKPPRINR